MEGPKQRTPEEIAEIEKSRTLSDAELLKGGAHYVIDEKNGRKSFVLGESSGLNDPNFERIVQENSNVYDVLRPEHVEKALD